MDQLGIGNIEQKSRLESLSKEQVIQRCLIVEDELERLIRENYELRGLQLTDSQLTLILNEQLDELKSKIFGRSSERYKKSAKTGDQGHKPPSQARIKKPSERYPNLTIREQEIKIDPLPSCPCCGEVMSDSGMTEDSEQLTVIPKKYEIIRQKRAKYRCSCQAAIVTAPAPVKILPGSTYSDEMITDVALSKYCDLIPIQRYVAMADRAGIFDLPANSLIDTTHSYADFVSGAYSLLKIQTMNNRVLSADETPHRMLEGDDKKTWFLWGFSTQNTCYLECRDTRSADVANQFLTQSQCEVLVSDVYSGYGKAVREANQIRTLENRSFIKNAYCNAHARRYFFKAFPQYPEAKFYLDHYHEIYQLEDSTTGKPPPQILEIRSQIKPKLEAMKTRALEELPGYPRNGKYGKALRYLIDHYEGFSLFLTNADVPIDNNRQERLLRSHVVGRKTWYGTHSQRGALTAAVLFSLVETCKLNQVNPREYFKHLTEDLLMGAKPYTPFDFKKRN
jgi:transposase